MLAWRGQQMEQGVVYLPFALVTVEAEARSAQAVPVWRYLRRVQRRMAQVLPATVAPESLQRVVSRMAIQAQMAAPVRVAPVAPPSVVAVRRAALRTPVWVAPVILSRCQTVPGPKRVPLPPQLLRGNPVPVARSLARTGRVPVFPVLQAVALLLASPTPALVGPALASLPRGRWAFASLPPGYPAGQARNVSGFADGLFRRSCCSRKIPARIQIRRMTLDQQGAVPQLLLWVQRGPGWKRYCSPELPRPAI